MLVDLVKSIFATALLLGGLYAVIWVSIKVGIGSRKRKIRKILRDYDIDK